MAFLFKSCKPPEGFFELFVDLAADLVCTFFVKDLHKSVFFGKGCFAVFTRGKIHLAKPENPFGVQVAIIKPAVKHPRQAVTLVGIPYGDGVRVYGFFDTVGCF